jgi:hypothetical protein
MSVSFGTPVAVLLLAVPALAMGPQPARLPVTPAAAVAARPLPLAFEPNAGQTDPSVRFLARTRTGTIFFTSDGLVVPDLRMRFVDSNPHATIEGGAALPGKISRLVGNDPRSWQKGLPTFSEIRYVDVFPGVILSYAGGAGPLKGTYTVAPGADPARIRWRYDGGRPRVQEDGRLEVLSAPDAAAVLTEEAPIAWQDVEGRRVPVAASYAVADDGSVGFRLGEYDRARPLTVDPVISYSTYLGGLIFDMAWGLAVDAAGNAYIGGYAASSNFPTVMPYQPAAGGQGDAFVAKFTPDGTPVYSTYLGGTYVDYVTDIAVDSQGNAYVTGFTGSVDLPVVSAFQPAYAGGWDSFVAKLNPNGSALLYCSYLGGSNEENATGIAVDAAGAAYVTGNTQSADFPVASPFQPSLNGTVDVYVTKVNPSGASLGYSTFLGGERGETGYAIAVWGNQAVVTGDTTSFTFPVERAFQPACAPSFAVCWDAFVTKFSGDGTQILFSTYLGGNDQEYIDRVFAVAVDGAGLIYVTGMTGSPNFPVANAYQPFYGGQVDVFVTRFNQRGRLMSSTFLGGNNSDVGYGIAVDGPGAPSPGVHISGLTLSENFPVVNPIQGSPGGFEDPFVAKFTPNVLQLSYSTYLGGSNGREEWGSQGIGLDAAGNVYVTGATEATDYPTVNPYQAAPHGSYDVFLTRINAVGIAGAKR